MVLYEIHSSHRIPPHYRYYTNDNTNTFPKSLAVEQHPDYICLEEDEDDIMDHTFDGMNNRITINGKHEYILGTSNSCDTFIESISVHFNDADISDIVLKVGNENYSVHKFILAKSSDVFKSMLYGTSWNDRNEAVIELHETDECSVVFSKFLKYFYTANMKISLENVVSLLSLADKYQVIHLINELVTFMKKYCISPNFSNALSWYPLAKRMNLSELMDHCKMTICWNFGSVIESEDWLHMDMEFIKDMLSSSDLVVGSEFILWNALINWIKHKSRIMDLDTNCKNLLPLIRFPQMYVGELKKLETDELAQTSEGQSESLLMKLISDSYRFRALCSEQDILELDFSKDYYSPRNYTSRIVDKVCLRNNIRFGSQADVKCYRGPAPKEIFDADWKICYRKKNKLWSLQVYYHDSLTHEYKTRASLSILILNEKAEVIQIHDEPIYTFSRGIACVFDVSINDRRNANNLAVIIKPRV